jgi:hypothetical protein
MSTAAAFLALAGGSTAVALSGKNSVKKDDIAKGAVRADDIAKGAVLSSEVAADSLGAGDLGAGSAGASEIADGSVGAAELGDASVGASEHADVPTARIERRNPVSLTNNLVTTIQLDRDDIPNDEFDPFDMWTPGDPTNVVLPVGGVYLAIGEVTFAADDTATAGEPGDRGMRNVRISATGPGVFASTRSEAERFDAGVTTLEASGIVNADAGDDISVIAAQTNEDASAVDVTAATLQVIWLGPPV